MNLQNKQQGIYTSVPDTIFDMLKNTFLRIETIISNCGTETKGIKESVLCCLIDQFVSKNMFNVLFNLHPARTFLNLNCTRNRLSLIHLHLIETVPIFYYVNTLLCHKQARLIMGLYLGQGLGDYFFLVN